MRVICPSDLMILRLLPNLSRTEVVLREAVVATGLSACFLTRLGCSTPAYSHASSGKSESDVVDVAGRFTAAPSRLKTDCSCKSYYKNVFNKYSSI